MSRPRSGRAANTTSGGRPAARPGVFVHTPQSDVFELLLGIALVAMLLGCLLLLILIYKNGGTKVSYLPPSGVQTVLALETAPAKFPTERL